MNDQAAFVRAICEEPEDDLVRLVYADWLEENEQADRAEIIRVQIEIAGIRSRGGAHSRCCHSCGVIDCRMPVLRERDRRIWKANSTRWIVSCPRSSVGPGVTSDWTRGFVNRIHLSIAGFLTHAKELFAEHPIERVVLTDRDSLHERVVLTDRDSLHPAMRPGWADIDFVHPNNRCGLPAAIFDLLARPHRVENPPPCWLYYTTPEAADTALSDACVDYGRERAGLSEIVRTDRTDRKLTGTHAAR